MSKIKSLLMLCMMTFLFVFIGEKVKANSVIIYENPVAESLVYGEPLFESSLIGGSASVDGVFKWVEEDKVEFVGINKQRVLFVPNDSGYNMKEFEIDVKVEPRRVYIKFEEELRKQYDGNDMLYLPNYIVNGIIDKDVYVKGDLKATLESAFIGENINVNLKGIELAGDKKDNYYLDLSNYKAKVYPKYIEMFGDVKNRIDLSENVYISIKTNIIVKDIFLDVIDGYDLIKAYDVYLESNGRIDIRDDVKVKIKIEEFDLKDKNIKLFNYYGGEYEEIKYSYEDGYLIYECDGLGNLVITKKKVSYLWLYILIFILIVSFIAVISVKYFKNKKKINKYRSLSRRKDYGNY